MPPRYGTTILGAIDVGTNTVRLGLARPRPDGALETLHVERDPVRPGEGVFKRGVIGRPVAERLVSTLRRYAALCRRHKARVRAVATSAVREARNGAEIVRRVKREAGITLEVIQGKEEARLICMGILQGRPRNARSLVIDIGGGSTEVATAVGEDPKDLWSVALGAVRLTELFRLSREVSPEKLRLAREFAAEVAGEMLPNGSCRLPRNAFGSSGTIRALVSYCAAPGTAHMTARRISRAVDDLAAMSPDERRKRFDAQRAEIIVAGAVILEAMMKRLGLVSVIAVDRGLRHGLLVDMLRRSTAGFSDAFLTGAAEAIGRRFYFDERHGKQVARIAVTLFDDLTRLHKLPAAARPYLEVAALLHDIGHAVSYQRHHKHTYYLIQNTDIPGLSDREREIVARIARYHRKSEPEARQSGMEGLSPTEVRLVRKLATLLRVADALDRSHHQPIHAVRASVQGNRVTIRIRHKDPVDLELWDASREAVLFRRVFRKTLQLQARRR